MLGAENVFLHTLQVNRLVIEPADSSTARPGLTYTVMP